MRKYYVYSLNCPELDIPKYIGISNDPERRYIEHLEDKTITKKTKWLKSLNSKPILKIIKESENIHEIIDLEIKLIRETENLTNTTKGGEYLGIGTPVDVYDFNYKLIGTFSSMVEACEIFKINSVNYSGISASCKRKRNYAYNKIWRYIGDPITNSDKERMEKELKRSTIKKVLQYDLNGNFIKEYESIAECGRNGFSKSAVSQMLSKSAKNYSVKGFIFCNNESELVKRLEEYEKSKPLKVNQLTMDGKIINTFNSINDACIFLDFKCQTTIKKCCDGIYKQCKGYKWQYVCAHSISNN